jgi:hypothetical protein
MTDTKNTDSHMSQLGSAFESKLGDGRQRFLAHAIEHAFNVARRSAEDFMRHFPPEVIMEGMAAHPELRASILTQTTGLKRKIALKKSWQAAAEDLRIALTEGETDAVTIVSLLDPDDKVRYLPRTKIWAFLAEGGFWNVTVSRSNEHRIAKEHIAFLLERALKDGLITHRDIVDGITVTELSVRLPKSELGRIIDGAVLAGREKKPFTDLDLWALLTAPVLVEHVPLTHIWSTVIAAKIAAVHGFSSGADSAPTSVASTSATDQEWVELPEDTVAADDVVSEDDFA